MMPTLEEQFTELMRMFEISETTRELNRDGIAFEKEKAMRMRIREADEDIARLRDLER